MPSYKNGHTLLRYGNTQLKFTLLVLDNKEEIAVQLVKTTEKLCTRLTETTQSL